ncbi:MAG: CDP-alcohol phosphatidyltransferase family protein [Pseudomonadota bacterium]|nr:CDP-alcohol phosphatidyltransferase family protein [Pseudomonadota bacterium]
MIHHLPNLITLVRFVLIFPTAWFIWEGNYVEALILMLVAGLSDGLDGALARGYRWTSKFGELADPLADKLLVGMVFVLLTIQGHIPLWVALIVIGRDLVIVCGAMTFRQLFGALEIDPTLVSKINTGLQVIVLVLKLIDLSNLEYLADLARLLVDPVGMWLVAGFSLVSGLDYVITWSRRSIRQWRNPNVS